MLRGVSKPFPGDGRDSIAIILRKASIYFHVFSHSMVHFRDVPVRHGTDDPKPHRRVREQGRPIARSFPETSRRGRGDGRSKDWWRIPKEGKSIVTPVTTCYNWTIPADPTIKAVVITSCFRHFRSGDLPSSSI